MFWMNAYISESTTVIMQLHSWLSQKFLNPVFDTFFRGEQKALTPPGFPLNTDPLHCPPPLAAGFQLHGWVVPFYPNKRQIRLVGMATESGGETEPGIGVGVRSPDTHTHSQSQTLLREYSHTTHRGVRRLVFNPSWSWQPMGVWLVSFLSQLDYLCL